MGNFLLNGGLSGSLKTSVIQVGEAAETVKYTSQILGEAQQEQARQNIGAVDKDFVENKIRTHENDTNLHVTSEDKDNLNILKGYIDSGAMSGDIVTDIQTGTTGGTISVTISGITKEIPIKGFETATFTNIESVVEELKEYTDTQIEAQASLNQILEF